MRVLTLALISIIVGALLGLVPGYMTARIIDSAIPHGSFTELVMYVGYILIAAALTIGSALVQGWSNAFIGQGIMRDLRTRVFGHLLRVPISFFTDTKPGEILNRVSGDIESVNTVLCNTFPSMVTDIALIVSTLIAMFAWNWRLALISVAILPFMILPLSTMGQKLYHARKRTRIQSDILESIAQQTLSISGMMLVKSFTCEKYERKRFYEIASHLMGLEIHRAMVGRWFISLIMAMVVAGPAIIWLSGGWLALHRAIDVGTIVAFIAYIETRLYDSASSLVNMQADLTGAYAVFQRIFEYLNLPTEPRGIAGGNLNVARLAGDIRFDDVAFSYGGRRPVLQGLSFHISPGQMAAVVGPSGAGKTTIANLLLRFYDAQFGRVLVDGQDIREMELAWFRRHIGIVTQETFLFHDTIADNLRYAKPDATDPELAQAARAANIHDFICSLPDGYETIVGERGYKLSGGERQRIAIARVLLKDPRILVLDEATSSLDAHAESAIQSALYAATRNRTSLLIAHRLSTVLNADVIFALNDGRIVEFGTHAALLARGGFYASLYQSYLMADKNADETSV
ncbi:MAG: ABC transporter ATP-binding protein [Candidatus Cybelea sp.]